MDGYDKQRDDSPAHDDREDAAMTGKQADTVVALRGIGLTMAGRSALGEQIGWTTDGAKAEKARELGGHLRPYRSSTQRFCGWEIVVYPDPPEDDDAG